jgi:hypothetical protein
MKFSKLNLNYLFSVLTLISASIFANMEQGPLNLFELPQDEIFHPTDGENRPLKGKIVAGRYHAPKDIFSCQAYDFDEGSYTAQDVLWEREACVGFYSSIGDFKEAWVAFVPEVKDRIPNEKELKDAFTGFGIEMLKTFDKAQGIETLKEEMLDNSTFFAAVSIEKMSTLKASSGESMASTKGYLIFQIKDKLVILINQRTTPLGHNHAPKRHIEKLKQALLEFKKTFEFGAIPTDLTPMLDPS